MGKISLIIILLVSSLFHNTVYAQISISNGEKTEIEAKVAEELLKLGVVNKTPTTPTIIKVRSIDDELVCVLADLAQYVETEKPYQVYFTFYHIDDPALLKKFYLELAFWVHSLSSENLRVPPQPVEGSPTLFKIDIRNYGWTTKAWEKVSVREAYIREPWIPHDTYSALRIEGGNNLIRGDWFLSHTSSPVKQLDIGDKEILYETLLYARLGRSPKNIKEFYEYWGYDVKKIEIQLHTVEQILVPHGKSGVARGNRTLARVQTELGPFWSSSDFLNSTGAKNVLENLYPDVMLHPNRDAGEHIGRNKIGLQHYLITNEKDENVWVANERIAFDRTDARDVTVMAGRSCAICHSQGINIPFDGMKAQIEKGIKLRYADKAFALAADRTYFGPLSFRYEPTSQRKTLIEKDRESFNDAVQDVNGLDGSTNALYFKEVLDWYENDLTLEQAARECGVTVEEFQTKIPRTISGRLGDLANGGTVSRQEWEDVKNGYFAQSMMLLRGLGKTIIQTPYQIAEIVPEAPIVEEAPSVLYIVTTKSAELKSGKRVLAKIKKGSRFEVLETRGDWYRVSYNNTSGWLYNKFVTEEQ